jgi:hypothetical protein
MSHQEVFFTCICFLTKNENQEFPGFQVSTPQAQQFSAPLEEKVSRTHLGRRGIWLVAMMLKKM